MTLDHLNHEALMACCGSERWVAAMLSKRPFADNAALHDAAERIWWSLEEADWLQAFSRHPEIGEKSVNEWSAQEQQGMALADQGTTDAMMELNRAYKHRFGWIFIICASGKSADEMRRLLEERLGRDPVDELHTAAGEQAKIMHIRLNKLVAE
jgi:2-oxo-4-hydroxy-4-carboxy-5-ureidoimidazoline decarboxylase